jgi:hypothetical protein
VTANSDKETHYYGLTNNQADICDKAGRDRRTVLNNNVCFDMICLFLVPSEITHVMYVMEGTLHAWLLAPGREILTTGGGLSLN